MENRGRRTGRHERARARLRALFNTPLIEDPLERRLAGQVRGVLWIGGGLVVVAPAVFDAASPTALPLGIAVAVAALAILWGVLCISVLDWVDGRPWLGHFTAIAGLVTLFAVVTLTGQAQSVGWQYYIWLALFGATFHRPRVAIFYMLLCLFAQALPLIVDPSRSWDGGEFWRLALVGFGYGSVGGAIIRAKALVRELRRRAERAADVDPVTGLFNERRLDRALRGVAARAGDGGPGFALALLDIDHLSRTREVDGQGEVERVMRELAGACQRCAGSHDVIARTGSDEFSWLMPDADAYVARERVDFVRHALDHGASGRRPAFSAGIADTRLQIDPAALVRMAGGALYWAKMHGRGQTSIYDVGLMDVLSGEERADRLQRSQALVGLQALARAIDAKDPATAQHSERVADLAEALARVLAWEDGRALALRDAALVHDVGKIGIDDAILRKASPLDREERRQVNAHAEISAQIVDGVLDPEQVSWIRTHHERTDGGGYPAGLIGSQIPLGGALLAVADAFDVMTQGRVYSRARTQTEALDECRAQAGRHFDHQAVAALEVWLLSQAATASLVS